MSNHFTAGFYSSPGCLLVRSELESGYFRVKRDTNLTWNKGDPARKMISLEIQKTSRSGKFR
jgi:hypothetical protein